MKIPPLSTLCCMDPACKDHDCPGRILNSGDGGHCVAHGAATELLQRRLPRIGIALACALVLVCGAAIVLGFPIHLPST